MSNSGLLIGRMNSGRQSIARAVASLFNPRVPSRTACERFLGAFRKGESKPVRIPVIHSAIIAPPGSGKSTGLVIPHLLSCRDSCVVVDIKSELARVTARARRAMGHRVVFLDPFKCHTRQPDTFNPLQHIDPNEPDAIDSCRDLAEALVVRTGSEKDPFWNDSAEKWIESMAAMVVAYSDETGSLPMVKDFICNAEKREKALEVMKQSDAWQGILSQKGHDLSNHKDKELASVLTSASRHLRFLDTPSVSESTKASSFNPAELTSGRMTIYLIIPPEHMRAQAALLRMWIGSLLRAVVKGGQR